MKKFLKPVLFSVLATFAGFQYASGVKRTFHVIHVQKVAYAERVCGRTSDVGSEDYKSCVTIIANK